MPLSMRSCALGDELVDARDRLVEERVAIKPRSHGTSIL